MKKRYIILTCILAALVMSASIGGAVSYFTTYAEARGGGSITLGDETHIDEKVVNGGKKVAISNKKGSQPVYVRVRAFASEEEFPITYEGAEGSGWTEEQSDGWCYYNEPLAGNSETGKLNVWIKGIPEGEAARVKEHFNVVVVYETIPAVEFREDGTPVSAVDADWTRPADRIDLEGGE